MKPALRIWLSALPLTVTLGYLIWVFTLEQAGRLPSPVATHWGIGGAPDGFSSLETHLSWAGFSFGLTALIWLGILWYPKIPGLIRLILLAIAGILFAIMALIQFWVIQIQIDLLDATLARFELPFLVIFVPILVLLFVFLGKPKITIDSRLSVSVRGIPMFSSAWNDIKSVSEERADWRDFGGLGLRVSKGKVAFLPSSGPVVQLETRAGETILVRSDRAAEQVREIREKLGEK